MRTTAGGSSRIAEAVLGAVLPELRTRHGASRMPAAAPVVIPATPSATVEVAGDEIDDEAHGPLMRALTAADEATWRSLATDVLCSPPIGDRAALRRRWLVPMARRLGTAWSEDAASFTDVTIGMGRLKWIMDAAPGVPRDGAGPRVLLTPTPGDGHVFGLDLLAEELREGGFAVEVHRRPTTAGIARAVSRRPIAVLGIGVSVTRHAGRAAALVRAARRAAGAVGRDVPLVIAGGSAARHSQALLQSVGVDAILDGSEAPSSWLVRRLGERGDAQGLESAPRMA